MTSQCVFCRIVRNELPCAKIYEDGKVLSFLDIAPTKKGHSLVIPKAHHETMMDVPDELLKEVITVVKKVSKAVMKATEAGGVNLALSMHETAGQTVPHAHFHVIPRHAGDGLKMWPQGKYEEGEIKAYSEKITKEIYT